MKRSYLFLLSFLTIMVFTHSGFSQEKIGNGIKIGLNIANFSVKDTIDSEYNSKTDFVLGVFTTSTINDVFSIQPELLYTKKGAVFEEETNPVKNTLTFTYTYLELSILFKWMLLKGNADANILIGPALGQKLNTKVRRETEGTSGVVNDVNVKDIDFGLVFGGDFGLNMEQGRLIFDVRYTLGLNQVNDELNLKNRVISITAGFLFKKD